MSNGMKKIDKDSLNAEERILKAATDVFAEKGYDAAGVDEIAKRADVTKPLIYYYFKGKKTILEELIKRYLKAVVEEKEQYINSINTLDKEMLYKHLDEKIGIFSKNKKVLKIIAMEMLKEKPVADSVLSSIYQMYHMAMPKIEEMGIEIEDPMDIIVTSFFFGTVPTLSLMLFGDKFCDFYDIDRDELDKRFFKAMKSVYLDYFIEYFKENKK
ncbi:MAG: TetR/AcrR family transcriptional regulator [Firmicutes bacterium]|nr:TetR/AcrR family transcriptional regulator [Bacillota bacterium]